MIGLPELRCFLWPFPSTNMGFFIFRLGGSGHYSLPTSPFKLVKIHVCDIFNFANCFRDLLLAVHTTEETMKGLKFYGMLATVNF